MYFILALRYKFALNTPVLRPCRENMKEEDQQEFMRNVQCTIEKDVVRTDRSHPYFKGDDNPNIEVLKWVDNYGNK